MSLIWTTGYTTAQSITDSLVIEDELHVHFDSDKFHIALEDREKINVFIRKYFDPEFIFRLDVHTDSDGSEDYNIKLSRKRCNGIKELLLKQNIAADRIDYYSHGEGQLLVAETDAEQKSKNRRATLKVFLKKEFISFQGNLTPENSEEVVTGDIYVEYENHKNTVSTDTTGRYKLKLPTNEKVVLNILAKNHFPLKKEITLTNKSQPEKIKFQLTKYDINNSIRTKIQFKGNKSIVLKKSIPELEYLGLSLISNPDICVELEGHINRPNQKPIPRDDIDFGLSIARSLVVFNYLVQQGISPDRLLAKGYGNSRMIYPKAGWEKEQSANRRVEVKVLPCDETATTKNDAVPDLSYYNEEEPLAKDFSYKTKNEDLKLFPKFVQQELISQIEYMEYHKKDPERHTYFELLSMARRRSEN